MTTYQVNGIELCAETYGDPSDPGLLLIHGAGASMIWWDAELCTALAERGRFVIRYDQRDTGRSTSFPLGAPGYAMSDLAADAVGLLDALGVSSAHVVAQSMSGGTALILGVDHPSRVASLTFVSASTGAKGLPPPSMPHLAEPDYDDPAAVEEYVVRTIEAEAAGHFDEAAARALVRADMARARNYRASLTNHYAMIFDAPPYSSLATPVPAMPVLVMHGDADPLLPLPHGEAVRDAIPGSRFVVLHGMGHGLSAPYWKTFVDEVVAL